MKSRVLALVHGEFSSHTVRVLEIAKRLRENNNYEIIFSGQGVHMKTVELAGFPVIETRTIPGKDILGSIENELFPVMFNKENIEALFQEEDNLLKSEKPEMIIRDSFRELAGIAAKQYRIYDVFLQQANLSHYYHADFKPRNTPRFLKVLPEDHAIKIPGTDFAPLIRIGEMIFRRNISKYLHKKTRQLGIKLESKCYEGVEADLILIPDSSLLFPFTDMKKKYKFIGPVLASDNSVKPKWLEDFISDSRRKIITTSGSTGTQDRTELFAEAFKNGKYAAAVHNNSRELPRGLYGGNFDISSVLNYADVFITHGGIGSTYLGLMAGTPMITIYSHLEQQANASQLRKLGAGISLNCDKVSPEGLREKVDDILENPAYKERARVAAGRVREEERHSSELAVKYINEGYGDKR